MLGAAGLLPFLAGALIGLGTREPLASQSVTALLFYGAVILSFLGGVHWGFVLGERPVGLAASRGSQRLVGGVLPALLGWAALLLGIVAPAYAGLPVLIVGFIGLVVAEQRWRREGLVPAGYMALRWGLTVVVVLVLTGVLVARLLGLHLNL